MIALPGAAASESSGAVPRTLSVEPLTAAAPDTHCPSARKGLAFYRGRYYEHRARMGAGDMNAERSRTRPSRGHISCPHVRDAARIWKSRAFVARTAADYMQTIKTLRDFPFTPGSHAWPRAVREVQRVFPGTEAWLLSCSAAEGGHGRWVGYGGVGYSIGLRDSDTVGGPLQFRFSTFTGMFRRGAEYVKEQGFRVPAHLSDSTTAWRSALGQAIAGGWARYTGNDDSHWSASWSRGC